MVNVINFVNNMCWNFFKYILRKLCKVSCYVINWSNCMDSNCIVISMIIFYNIDRMYVSINCEILLYVMI